MVNLKNLNCPQQAVHQRDELHDAHSPLAPLHPEPLIAARCVNGTLLRPGNAEEEPALHGMSTK